MEIRNERLRQATEKLSKLSGIDLQQAEQQVKKIHSGDLKTGHVRYLNGQWTYNVHTFDGSD